jgi:lysophospholipase L1-like esterase
LPKELEGMKAEYSTDGVHPNEAGYEVMEPLAEKAISKALTQK